MVQMIPEADGCRIGGVMRKLAVCAIVFALSALLSGCLTGKIRRELAAEYFNLGNAFFELKNYDRAMTLYQKAIDYSDELPENSYNLARVYISQERYEEAIEVLDALLAAEPDNLILLQTLAYAYAKEESFEEAAAAYQRILSISEGNVITFYNLGILAEAEKNPTEAYSYLKLAYGAAPDDADVLGRLGRLEAEHGSIETAIGYLQSYMEKKTGDADTAVFLTGLLKKDGQFAEALTLVETSLTHDAAHSGLLFEQAYLFLTKAGERVKGMETLTKSLEAGFIDKEKAGELLLDAPPAVLKDVQSLLVEKNVLTAAEAEEILADALE